MKEFIKSGFLAVIASLLMPLFAELQRNIFGVPKMINNIFGIPMPLYNYLVLCLYFYHFLFYLFLFLI